MASDPSVKTSLGGGAVELSIYNRDTIRVWYRNHRGETALRSIQPKRIWYGSSEWHPAPQWLMTAWDIEKGAERHFAIKDMEPEGEVERNIKWG